NLSFMAIGLISLVCFYNVSVAQLPFPPDRSPVIVDGTILKINDCSERRFFLAGMVDNEPSGGLQLSLYNHAEMETQIVNHKAIGATAMRWNTFLRGIDLRWDANGYVIGMCDSAVAHIKDGLDLAYKHGIVIQIVLSTAHFLSYGWDGETPENVTRVNNNKFMFENTVATQAYIDNVIKPITQTIGVHPGLFGYCIINEASGMYFTKDAGTGTWSDVKVHMSSFQKFVNLVASEIHTNQPGALCSVSGIAFGLYQYTDAILIAAGGKTNGTLDINQLQFYPENHKEDWSPFTHTIQQLVTAYGGELKPLICGESPIEGNPTFGLEEGLVKLWDMGNNGYFTWSYNVYDGMTTAEKAVVDAAYTDFYAAYLVNNDFNGSQCPNHLYVTPVSQTVPVSAGSTDLIIISDKSWSASSDATWCSLSPSSGSNNDTISVVRTANTGAGRTANITLSASGVPNYIVSVYQEGDYLHISPLSKNVGHTAGVVNLTVSSNLSNWTASSDAGWCTVSPSSGSNNGVVTATYTENTGAERTANIIFPVSGAPDVVVTITQALIGVFQQSTGSDKLVSVEAEHFNRNRDGTGDFSTHIWIETTSPSGYSGNSAMITNPNNSTNASDVGVAEDYAPLLEYGVNFVTTGTHYIWLLVCTNGSSGDNSFHSGLDGSISAANLNLGTSQSWVWKELLNGGARATIDVTSTGAHTFGIFMREDGARVDKFVLTTNIDYVPAGTGPTESKQVDIDLFSVLHTDKNQYSLSIYPNPSSGNAHLNFGSNKVEDVEINISNLVGQQLISKSFESVPLTNGIDLALQSLKNGIYLIQCKMEGHTQSIRFIKN
ncbi:MAG: BACON domain-containing carbohydrate-binding protein, partial [Bacteroidia bacterium]|nr:BACON domain-containing carbohydrate-binding protein [Bacteroidia bacterium]